MTEPRLAAALRSAARTLDHDGMPAAVDRRVRERVALATSGGDARRPVRRMRWWLASGVAATVAVAVTMAVVVLGRAPEPRLAGFEVVDASPDLQTAPQADGALAVITGHATLRATEAGMTIATRTPVRLRKEPAGIRLTGGAIEVFVAKRHAGEPAVRVDVSHGAILVVGTRFRLEQRDGGGQVWLLEGAIVFVADDGRRRDLRPGDSLSWPLPPEAAVREAPSPPSPPAREAPVTALHDAPRPSPVTSPPSHPAVVPSTPPSPAPMVETPAVAQVDGAAEAATLLRDVAELRARGRYREAAEAIERRLDQPGLGDATREIMSFELVSILTYQLADPVRACAAAGRHVRAFPRSRHAAAVASARVSLGCRDEPGTSP